MVKGFSNLYNFSFFGQLFFCKHFYYITGFCDKKFNFCKFANFFADSKSRAQELSNDVSFVTFGHQTWDLEGGVKLTPPQHILVFKYPRVNICNFLFFIFTGIFQILTFLISVIRKRRGGVLFFNCI